MFDVVVIGAGHAGVEAAAAAARRGAQTALITFSARDIGQMSCNPSIGGVGKGHLVRELDALGGIMGRAGDAAAIHRRMLNASKGPAVRGPRIQADRTHFARATRALMPDMSLIEGEVVSLKIERGACTGVVLADGQAVTGRAVVLATGTFLGAKLFRGNEVWAGGRLGGRSSSLLAEQVISLGMSDARLKTGTPPRLDGRTIDWAQIQPQYSDRLPFTLSNLGSLGDLPQLACGVTRTTDHTHQLIRAGMDRSPLRSGAIEGRGPRYCPSIEDKVERFSDRSSHQVFLEPEGLESNLVYPNGISTSLPADVQLSMCRSMPGLERVSMVMAGYAVEYAYADPRNLDSTLEHRDVRGLFFAGQLNGTTGYEEAGAQGLVAGACAAARALGVEALTLDRRSSYIGVMIDDLVLQGVSEPYRMLTARAEHRLALRADNALSRLAVIAETLGLLTPDQESAARAYRQQKQAAEARLGAEVPGVELGVADTGRRTLADWARREDTFLLVAETLGDNPAASEALHDALYAPYLEREDSDLHRRTRDASLPIASDFSFEVVPGLSVEMQGRLAAARPATLGQAERVRGVSPAALAALHFALKASV